MTASRSIPSYELYGDFLAGSYVDPVHHETIKERSSQHDWTIRLHRHRRMFQIFVFRTPGVSLRLGEVEHTTSEPVILVVPPGLAHGFRFSEDIAGDVLSIQMDALDDETLERVDQFSHAASGILTRDDTAHFDSVDALMRQLRSVYRTVGPERTGLLRSIVHLMVLYLAAELRGRSSTGPLNRSSQLTPHEMQADRFCTLVEANFATHCTVSEYADMIGVSAPHLTRVCKRVLGMPPNELVRQRRIVEAKRLLEYTRLSVSDIAHRSGFRDAAFFSRTFKASAGRTPQEFRREKDG